MTIELPSLPNIPGSPRWVEVAQARERILLDRIAELEADLASFRKYHARTLDAAIDAARKA